jgi:hypothetical protein
MTKTRTAIFAQLVREAIEARLSVVNVSLPCKVLKYDKAKNTVNLQPLLKRRRRKKDGTTVVSEIPSLQNVPVAFQRVNGSWITLPIEADDVGMVVFSQRSLGEWMGKAKGEVVEPTDEELHPLGGAWFYPGGYPSASPIESPGDQPTWHTDDKLDLGEKNLTDDDLVAIAKLVKQEISSVRDTLNNFITIDYATHLHPSGMGPTGTPAVPASNTPGPVGDVKATKVRAK